MIFVAVEVEPREDSVASVVTLTQEGWMMLGRGTKAIRSGGWVMAGPEDHTDGSDIMCVQYSAAVCCKVLCYTRVFGCPLCQICNR